MTRPPARLFLLVLAAQACGRDVLLGREAEVDVQTDGGAPERDWPRDAGRPEASPPTPESFAWRATHESGDFSEWETQQHGIVGARSATAGTALEISDEQAHEGRFAVKAVLGTDQVRLRHAKIRREGLLPGQAIYRAWFFLPRAYRVDFYWNLMQFRGRAQPRADAESLDLWDINFHTRGGAPELYAWDHVRQREWLQPGAAVTVPVGRWFQVAVLLRKDEGNGGRLVLMQDGRTLLDIKDVSTVPNAWLQWNVGSSAITAEPSPAVLFIDDAAIEPVP